MRSKSYAIETYIIGFVLFFSDWNSCFVSGGSYLLDPLNELNELFSRWFLIEFPVM